MWLSSVIPDPVLVRLQYVVNGFLINIFGVFPFGYQLVTSLAMQEYAWFFTYACGVAVG